VGSTVVNIVGRFLSDEDIVVGLDVSDKKRALEAVALLIGRRHQINHAATLRALWRREDIGSTALGHGVAIPHARITGISEPIVVLICTKVPIVFGAPDHKPVSMLFVILVPEHAHEEHLQILATVSEMFSDKVFRDRLSAATEPAAIQRLFREWVRQGAERVE
jgi:PTS system nitrogen regulatory IIA component